MENNWVTEEELVKAMMEEYEAEEEDLHKDVQEFLEEVVKKGGIYSKKNN